LLPKSGKLVLSKPQLFDQIEIAALAVSLEPLGGSPNGSPTTVLYTSELVIL
jgi:anti-sigma-K factor RskA